MHKNVDSIIFARSYLTVLCPEAVLRASWRGEFFGTGFLPNTFTAPDLPGSMAFRLLSFGRGRPFICRGVFNPRSAHDAGSASCDLASGRRLLFLAGGFQPPERLEDACFLPPGGFQPPERLQDARRNDIQAGAFIARLPNGRFIGSACHSLNSPL